MVDTHSDEQAWKALEEERQAPLGTDLKYLSGLLTDGAERFGRAWQGLDTKVRLELMQKMTESAEEDFEMDFSAIFRLALDDDDPGVRVLAIEGLHEDEDVRLVPRFARCLQQDPEAAVRSAAAQALGQFVLLGELGKVRPKPYEEALRVLSDCHQNLSEELEVRRRALESLAFCGLAEIEQAIREAYLHPEEKMRVSAVFAMGRSADKRWGDTVRTELHALTPEMRFEATRACGELQLREAVPELAELVEDGDAEVQEMALWALGQVGGELAVRTLRRYARSRDEALQSAAQAALDELEFFQGDLASLLEPAVPYDGEDELHRADRDDDEDYDEEDPEDEDDLWGDEDDDALLDDEDDDSDDDDPWR